MKECRKTNYGRQATCWQHLLEARCCLSVHYQPSTPWPRSSTCSTSPTSVNAAAADRAVPSPATPPRSSALPVFGRRYCSNPSLPPPVTLLSAASNKRPPHTGGL